LEFQKACKLRGLGFNVVAQWGDALIQRARQDLVARFMENSQATHLLFADGDVGFKPEQVFHLLDFGADIVAAVYPNKRLNIGKLGEMAREGYSRLESASLEYDFDVDDPKKVQVRRGFGKVRQVGMGFTLIRRRVFVGMMEKYPQLRYEETFTMDDPLARNPFRYALFNCLLDLNTGEYLAEDHSFCRRWTDMGGEIWLDLQSRLKHVGSVVFDGDFSTQFHSSFMDLAFVKKNS
jgi:hypothetical protein